MIVTAREVEEAARNGRPIIAEYHRVLAQLPPDEYPNLRLLVSSHDARTDFTDRVLTVLAGIAVRRGEAWQPILEMRGDGVSPAPEIGIMHP